MKLFRNKITIAVLSALLLAGSLFLAAQPKPAQAQAAGAIQVIAPLTRDLGALSTFATQGNGTVNSADQGGYNVSRVICAFNETSLTGSPSIVVSIQNKDAASGSYYTLLSTPTITSVSTFPVFLASGSGVSSATGIAVSYPLAQTWRVKSVFTGSGTIATGTLGCSVQ